MGESVGQVARHWPFFLVVGLANIVLYSPATYVTSHLPGTNFETTMALVYGLYVFNALLACLVYGTIIDFALQALHSPQPSGLEAVKLALRRWPALIWTMIVRWFWLILGFTLLIVPGVIWGYRQMLCWVVTTVEGISGPAALRRAQALMGADPSAYSIIFGQWLLSMLLTVAPSCFVTYGLLHQPAAVRTGIQWSLGVVNWLILGVFYFSMVRVYNYLRERLDRTPEADGVGFSPAFEL
ncbi:MAG: hypothetical protein KF760_04275 [Candidatus Eremiobacteraeota bacterium]|nr:hypothetical protein [Candidatus Eremiobacteraeota bacterium]